MALREYQRTWHCSLIQTTPFQLKRSFLEDGERLVSCGQASVLHFTPDFSHYSCTCAQAGGGEGMTVFSDLELVARGLQDGSGLLQGCQRQAIGRAQVVPV